MAISKNPLNSCGYALYIMHMIERMMGHTFAYDKEHHPLRIKNDLRTPVADRRAVAPRRSSPPRATRGRGKHGDKPLSPIRKMFNLLFGLCKSQHAVDIKAQHERRARKKDTKSMKEIHSHLNLQPPRSPIASKGDESPDIVTFEERLARFNEETPVQQWYGDVSFSGFDFDYSGMARASSSHPLPFDFPPPAHTHNNEGEESGKQDEDDE
jgi:hypothetical protein